MRRHSCCRMLTGSSIGGAIAAHSRHGILFALPRLPPRPIASIHLAIDPSGVYFAGRGQAVSARINNLNPHQRGCRALARNVRRESQPSWNNQWLSVPNKNRHYESSLANKLAAPLTFLARVFFRNRRHFSLKISQRKSSLIGSDGPLLARRLAHREVIALLLSEPRYRRAYRYLV